MTKVDVAIINGEIIDGSGDKSFRGSVLIDGEKIVDVCDDSSQFPRAKRVIDAKGKAVTPGFVDPHAHMDVYLLEDPMAEIYLRQGVTTLVNGNCGNSAIPGPLDAYAQFRGEEAALRVLELGWDFSDAQGYYDVIRKIGGTTVNVGTLIGHGFVRWLSMGGASENRPMTDQEQSAAIEYIEQAMQQGSLGMSTGLSYSPGIYSDTDEIVQLLAPVKEANGVYSTHIRYEGGYGFADPSSYSRAVREALEIGRKAEVRLQISHLDMGVTPDCYEIVDTAYKDGQSVTVDTIPKSTGYVLDRNNTLSALKSECQSFFNESLESFDRAIRSLEQYPKLTEELADNGFLKADPDDVLLANSGDPQLEGCTIREAAEILDIQDSTHDVVLYLLSDTDYSGGFMFGTRRDDRKPPYPPAEILTRPFVCPGADLIGRDVVNPFGKYDLFRAGTFPIFLQYCYKRGVIIEEAIRKMTHLPANSMGICGRGRLAPGYFADVLIFDPFKLRYPLLDDFDYSHPRRSADGLDWSIINGTVVIQQGDITGARPGATPVRRR